jgi:hypothetical protein
MKLNYLVASALAGVCLLCSACFFVADKPRAIPTGQVKTITAPAKAHLRDGSVVVFPDGFTVKGNVLYPRLSRQDDELGEYRMLNTALKSDLQRSSSTLADSVVLDSVAYLEYYGYRFDVGAFVATLPAVGAGAVGLAVAIFGSCPTVYTTSNGQEVMEAECFSYSVAPGFEGDDLDRLDHGTAVDNTYVIKLTNEALETHYINSLQLVAADHDAGFEAFPTPQETIVPFGPAVPLLSAHDLAGQSVMSRIEARDDVPWQSDSVQIAALAAGTQFEDGIELTVDVPEGARRMVVALKMRATLMNTVFFYDILVGSQGIAALDWMRPTPLNLIKAWRFSRWYTRHFGLRVQTLTRGRFKDAATIVNVGPIVWRDVAVEVEAPAAGIGKLRLLSVPGNWSVDWVGVSFDSPGDMSVVELKPVDLQRTDGTPATQDLSALFARDKQYLVTLPGDEYYVRFNVPPVPQGKSRSYFLHSRGYYIEWVRQSWIAQERSADPAPKFAMGTPALRRTAREWLERREVYEKEFFSSRFGSRKEDEQ